MLYINYTGSLLLSTDFFVPKFELLLFCETSKNNGMHIYPEALYIFCFYRSNIAEQQQGARICNTTRKCRQPKTAAEFTSKHPSSTYTNLINTQQERRLK
jgi:hypothetical protein